MGTNKSQQYSPGLNHCVDPFVINHKIYFHSMDKNANKIFNEEKEEETRERKKNFNIHTRKIFEMYSAIN